MFTHLHCHSYYSFSSGTIPADEIPLLAKQNGSTIDFDNDNYTVKINILYQSFCILLFLLEKSVA